MSAGRRLGWVFGGAARLAWRAAGGLVVLALRALRLGLRAALAVLDGLLTPPAARVRPAGAPPRGPDPALPAPWTVTGRRDGLRCERHRDGVTLRLTHEATGRVLRTWREEA